MRRRSKFVKREKAISSEAEGRVEEMFIGRKRVAGRKGKMRQAGE